MAETRAVNPLVEQFQKGGVPRDLRAMAAQGVLPLKPEDFTELLFILTGDVDEQIRQTAAATLAAFPADQMMPILKDRGTSPSLLGWALAHRAETELREAALQNTSTTDDAIQAVVTELPSNLAELVVINQVRLLRRTALLEALEANASLSNDQRRRLRELRESFHIGEAPAAPEPPPAATPEPEPAPAPPPEPEPVDETPLSEEQAVVQYLSEEERRQPEKLSSVQRICKMNTAEKVVAAIKGSKEERAILIRDRNRIVCTAVLGSPRVTDSEIEAFAAMKNVSEEILRKIAMNRDMTKNYNTAMNLVRNPRTPLAMSLGLVPRANPRDMKGLSVDRNVPEAIRKRAQQFLRAALEKK